MGLEYSQDPLRGLELYDWGLLQKNRAAQNSVSIGFKQSLSVIYEVIAAYQLLLSTWVKRHEPYVVRRV